MLAPERGATSPIMSLNELAGRPAAGAGAGACAGAGPAASAVDAAASRAMSEGGAGVAAAAPGPAARLRADRGVDAGNAVPPCVQGGEELSATSLQLVSLKHLNELNDN